MKNINFVVLLLIFSTGANAGLVTFTDRASWRNAVGGGTGDLTENFSSFTSSALYGNPTGITAGFLHFATVSGSYPLEVSWSISNSGVMLVSWGNGGGVGGEGDTRITFSNLIALGFDYIGTTFYASRTADPLSITTSLSDTITGPYIGINDTGFFGILYDAGEVFNSIRIQDLYDGKAFFLAQNFEAYTVTPAAVPVPSAVWLFVSGLIGLIGIKRKLSKEPILSA